MNFQDALTNLQEGKCLTRICWKDKTKYITLFNRPDKYQGYKKDGVFYRREAMNIAYYTHMDVAWLPTVNDILATDWTEI